MYYVGNIQKTLSNAISLSGIGLHTNALVKLTLRPAAVGTGIVFKRVDIPVAQSLIKARYDKVTETRLGTVIENEFGHKVSTIEHLMFAIFANGIDNLIIECNAPEVPVMDGSAVPFMHAIERAGIKTLGAPKKYIKIHKEIKVSEGDKFASLSPFSGFKMKFEIQFDSSVIGYQNFEADFSSTFLQSEISPARTFGFAEEVEALQKIGLARGGSLDNAVVIKDNVVLNENGLRFKDEFVRHKMLDAIGDLALACCPLVGYYHGYKSGHGLNNQLLRALFADDSAYSIVTAPIVIRTVPSHHYRTKAIA
jgi:UDP-3-O-[3-hydroxymyristoyl] N-acetylglucosamine deacetylase